MRTNDGLLLLGVVKALRVAEVRDVIGSDVVTKSDGEVSELAICRNVGVDGSGLLGILSEEEEFLSDTLVTIGILAEGVDDPDLTRSDSSRILVSHWSLSLAGQTYVARAADSGWPGMNLTSWIPPP